MQLETSLNICQQQKLILNQKMQQSLAILQMSATCLKEHIDKEVEENPILEETELSEMYNEFIKDSYYNKFNNVYQSNFNSYLNSEDAISPFLFISEKLSLKDYLIEQLLSIKASKKLKEILLYMIEDLDSKGYLQSSTEQISIDFKVSEEVVEEAIIILQNMEPYGIGARNIEECLLIQLMKMGIYTEVLESLINKHLTLVADNKYNIIANLFNITSKEAQEYCDLIKTLEPKPARGFFTGEDTKFIVPDAYIIKIEDNHEVILNREIIPKLTLSNLYCKELIKNDIEGNEYIKEKTNRATQLINDIEHRNNTLYKVLTEILNKQKKYFERGKSHLKPMSLKEIAYSLDVHESTISRAIKDKYIFTDYGIVKIKDLFTQSISKDLQGQDISTIKIKNRIKDIVNGENKFKPLSDQGICEILNRESVDISRRTVAKYREELEIKASSKRKRV